MYVSVYVRHRCIRPMDRCGGPRRLSLSILTYLHQLVAAASPAISDLDPASNLGPSPPLPRLPFIPRVLIPPSCCSRSIPHHRHLHVPRLIVASRRGWLPRRSPILPASGGSLAVTAVCMTIRRRTSESSTLRLPTINI
jgi:hypothetical protein